MTKIREPTLISMPRGTNISHACVNSMENKDFQQSIKSWSFLNLNRSHNNASYLWLLNKQIILAKTHRYLQRTPWVWIQDTPSLSHTKEWNFITSGLRDCQVKEKQVFTYLEKQEKEKERTAKLVDFFRIPTIHFSPMRSCKWNLSILLWDWNSYDLWWLC